MLFGYLNSPSFLLKLMTEVSLLYSQRSSALQSIAVVDANVDGLLRPRIKNWNYLIITDLFKSFYQIRLVQGFMKYCGVASSFTGFRV